MRNSVDQKKITDRAEKSVEKYLDDIRNTEPLSREQEVELSERIKRGDEKALHELIEANLKYVVTEAKKYQTGVIPLSELIAQGNLGAVKAAKNFDGTKGFKFITYLKPWVKQSILAYLSEFGRKLRLPANQVALSSKIRKFRENYQQSNGVYPSVDEIAIALDVKYESVNFLVNILKNVISMDTSLSYENNSTIGDTIEDTFLEYPTDKLMNESLEMDMSRVLQQLPPRDKDIVGKLFGIGYNREFSSDEVAEDHEISRERVRQIKEKALREMKRLIKQNNVI